MEQEKIQELKLEAVQVEGELAGLLGKAKRRSGPRLSKRKKSAHVSPSSPELRWRSKAREIDRREFGYSS